MVEIRQAEDCPDGEIRAALDGILDQEAAAAGHPFMPERLVFVAEEEGAMIGGLAATISSQWLHVDILALQPQMRGRGIGRQLLARAEALARARGLVGIWLDTHGFQAPDYYPRLGYVEYGRIEDQPPGHARRFFLKWLERGE